NFNFATLIRYERSFADDRLSFGVAAEMPAVSGTYGEEFEPIPQRVPDIPAYIQYAWGPERSSHLRASVVLRDMYLHNLRTAENTSLLGWGVQLSGTIRCCRAFRMFMNGVYGKGITPYIQDLTGAGLDFTPDPRNAAYIQTMPMWGWQAAGQFSLTRRLTLSGATRPSAYSAATDSMPTTSTSAGSTSSETCSMRSRRAAPWRPNTSTVRAATCPMRRTMPTG
ncbi:hypothetical protein OBE_12960, partial [human gut metagenome]